MSHSELEKAVDIITGAGLLLSPDYWNKNARKGKLINGEYARLLIIRMASLLNEGSENSEDIVQ